MDEPSNITSPVDEFAQLYVRPRAGRTLVVGSFVTKDKTRRQDAYPDALGVDMREGPGVDRVLNLEQPLPDDLGQFDHVECWSVLEHSRRPWLLAANLEALLVPGGTLHVAVPFVWGLHSYPGDHFRFTATGLQELFSVIDWTAVLYASDTLKDPVKTKRARVGGHFYIERTEVLAFGVRR